MVDAIEIIIKNGIHERIKAFFVYKDKVCYLNDKKYPVTEEILEELKRIIITWKNEYGSTKEIDVEEFNVTVIAGKQKDKYHGKGIYPYNYRRLKEIIGELYGR